MIQLTNNWRGRVGTNDYLYMPVLVVLTLNCFDQYISLRMLSLTEIVQTYIIIIIIISIISIIIIIN